MAVLNIYGAELQSTLEGGSVAQSAGAPAFNTSIKRSGAASLHCNVALNASMGIAVNTHAATGEWAAIGRTAETFYTFWFRFEALPGSSINFIAVTNTTNVVVCRLACSSGGAVTGVGSTTSATIATISADTWYRVDLRVTSNGTSGAKIDGGTEQTFTANNITQDRLWLGREVNSGAAFECYYDDAYISSTGFPTGGQCTVLWPTGAGNSAGWNSGTGSTFAEVDEVPHDTDTTYIKVTDTQDNTNSTFAMTDTGAAGTIGDISVVKVTAICRTESTSGTSNVGLRLRSGSTNSDTTNREWTSTYVNHGKILELDPNGSIAWTASGVDGIECGVFAATIVTAERCTQIAAMVWSDGIGGIDADVPAGLIDFLGVAPTATKAAAVLIGLAELLGVAPAALFSAAVPAAGVELVGVASAALFSAAVPAAGLEFTAGALVEPQSAAVPAAGVELLGVAPTAAHAAPVPAVAAEFAGVAPATTKSAALSAGIAKFTATTLAAAHSAPVTPATVEFTAPALVEGGLTAPVAAASFELLAVTPATTHSAPVAAAVLGLIATAPSTAKSAPLSAVSARLLPVAPATTHAASMAPALLDFSGVELVESGSTSVPAAIVELLALPPAVDHAATLAPVVALLAGLPPATLKFAAVPSVELVFLAITAPELFPFAFYALLGQSGASTDLRRQPDQTELLIAAGSQAELRGGP